jgi:hypothetical protein
MTSFANGFSGKDAIGAERSMFFCLVCRYGLNSTAISPKKAVSN